MEKATPINDLPFKKQQAQMQMQQQQAHNNQMVSNNQMVNNNPMANSGQGPSMPINTSPEQPMRMAGPSGPGGPMNAGVNPAAQFGQMPGGNALQKPDTVQKPSGVGQGFSAALKATAGKKEFFGLNESDYKSTIVVFALVLIFSSNIFFDLLRRYLPSVCNEGKVTLVGSLIAAVLASVIFIIIKVVAKL